MAMVSSHSARKDSGSGRMPAATAPALAHAVINLGRNDELPTVLIQEVIDNLPDFIFSDEITAADRKSVV